MTRKLAKEIQAEQCHGRQKYGSGPNDYSHDDAHEPLDWHDFIDKHNETARQETPMERRQRLVKIAGLAVSAIESFDRESENERLES